MTRYAVLLRAVNLGAHGKVPMAWLREAAAGAGFADVATYLQSGNLVVSADSDATEVGQRVADLLRSGQGLDTDVMVRDRERLAAVIDANPFPEHTDEPAKLLVSFLSAVPDPALVAALDPGEFAPERYVVDGDHLYLWHPNGVGRSKLAVAPWQRRIGVTGTARNWRTLLAIRDLLDR